MWGRGIGPVEMYLTYFGWTPLAVWVQGPGISQQSPVWGTDLVDEDVKPKIQARWEIVFFYTSMTISSQGWERRKNMRPTQSDFDRRTADLCCSTVSLECAAGRRWLALAVSFSQNCTLLDTTLYSSSMSILKDSESEQRPFCRGCRYAMPLLPHKARMFFSNSSQQR